MECLQEDCQATSKKSGYCERHYRVARRQGIVGWDGTVCSKDDCDRPAVSKSLCGMHYQQSLHTKKCLVEECDKYAIGKGYCTTHYRRVRLYGDPLAWRKPQKQICTVEDCNRKQAAHSLCDMHYRRQKRYGTTSLPERPLHVDPPKYTCKQCGKELPKLKHGMRTYCSDECREAFYHWYRKETHRKRWLKRYDLTPEGYDNLLKQQDYGCKICGTVNPGGHGKHFAVDHDHKTGKVRGLLCESCNTALGKLQDDVTILEKAILYVKDVDI